MQRPTHFLNGLMLVVGAVMTFAGVGAMIAGPQIEYQRVQHYVLAGAAIGLGLVLAGVAIWRLRAGQKHPRWAALAVGFALFLVLSAVISPPRMV